MDRRSGEGEWGKEWIGGGAGPIVSELFDTLKRLGIEYKTNNLFLAQW